MAAKRRLLLIITAALVLTGWLGYHASQPDQHSKERVTEHASPQSQSSFALQEIPASAPGHDDWTRRWQETETLTDESQCNQAKESLIEALALVDPRRAVEMARNESSEALRWRLMEAAMRGWGQVDPESALAWAAAQSWMDSGQATASIFHGAASDPERAIRLANALSQRGPERSLDHGLYLVAALARVGEFDKAADFAASSTSESRAVRIGDAYSRWAEKAPQQALAHAAQLNDLEARKTASNAIFMRWAYTDAPAAARHALSLSDPEDRRYAFSKALPIWVAARPVEAALWMSSVEPSPELDLVAASIATRPGASQNPKASTLWAENILEPKLRVLVMASVVHRWAETDPAAARHYAETSSSILPGERSEVLAALKPGFDPVSFAP